MAFYGTNIHKVIGLSLEVSPVNGGITIVALNMVTDAGLARVALFTDVIPAGKLVAAVGAFNAIMETESKLALPAPQVA